MVAACRRCQRPVPMSEDAIEKMAMFNGHLRRRALPPLTEFDVVECPPCFLLTRGEQVEKGRVELLEFQSLMQDLRRGHLPDERRIWGHPGVRSVMAGGYGPQCDDLIKCYFRRRMEGKGSDALD